MKWFNILRDRLRALRQRETVINDIDREMRSHLELQVEANIRAGMSPDEAREKAMRSFGNVNRAVDAAYDVKGGGLLETLTQDIRYGVRMLAKHKAFTAVAVITLALGIGANTAIFSVVNELLLRPLPYRDAERIVMLWEVTPEGRHQNTTSRANFRAWRDQSTSYEHIAAFTDQRFNLTGDGEPEELSVQFATPELFKVLGVDPILGRTFLPEDGRSRQTSRRRAQLRTVATPFWRTGKRDRSADNTQRHQVHSDRRDAGEFSVSHQTSIGHRPARRTLDRVADADWSRRK